jgi:tetratricopeptide (TPR) repeat protein
MAFAFQPQNIVANPDVMFFKADTTDHREKLKTIFPYVLGAVSPDVLQARHEIDRLSRVLRRKESELRAREASGAAWQREGQAWILQAVEYGLLAPDFSVQKDWPETVDTLREVLNSDTHKASPTLQALDSVMARLTELRQAEAVVTAKLSGHRQRLHELRRLEESSDAYGEALRVQRDRLSLSTWIRELSADAQGSFFALTENGHERIAQLCEALDGIEVRLRSHPGVAETLGKETLRQREATQNVLDELNAVRREIQALESNSDAVKESVANDDRAERFLGRLEEALRLYEAADKSSSLHGEISDLRAQISALQKVVAEHEIARKLKNALDSIEGIAGTLIPKLDGEWPDAPVKLIIADLTVKVIRGTRDDYLWEIGSGANWLAYHIAVTLALQKFFLSNPNHPVPGLLMYDQPSQVYFPARRASSSKDAAEEPSWRDEDIVAVRKVFGLLNQEVEMAKGRLQVVVLDHADDEVWGQLPNVHLVEEWRGGALVPLNWLPAKDGGGLKF